MRRHALLVGVDDYSDQTISKLKGAVNDAIKLHAFFHTIFDRAEVLVNPVNDEVILNLVTDVSKDLEAGDEFLFFFAGHGIKTQDGPRLVCAGDNLDRVRHGWAGLPLECLKYETNKAFNRLFLLDVCRTDVLETNRGVSGVMEQGTRDLILAGAGERTKDSGALTILCSCNDGQCAGEIPDIRHGLFSKALLDLLTEGSVNKSKVVINDDFVDRQIPRRMQALARQYKMSCKQRPQKEGPAVLILDGKEKPEEPILNRTSASTPGNTNNSTPIKAQEPMQQRNFSISDWTVELEGGLPGHEGAVFTMFETLSRYLFLLQGLGTYEGQDRENHVFGSEAFRRSAWKAVTGSSKKSHVVICPSLTDEDVRAIKKAGGMERLARTNRLWSVFKELETELEMLKAKLKAELQSERAAGSALVVDEVIDSLKIEEA